MLIEYGDSKGGLIEYLINGRKAGREFTRDELDTRVPILGDIDVTKHILANSDCGAKHITLSFKEEVVTQEECTKLIDEYMKFAMHGYKAEEFNAYAEIHQPKTKSYIGKNGEIILRKPHIHLVIVKKNLLSGKALNPLGFVKHNIDFTDAFQEKYNLENGYASPKNNRSNKIANDVNERHSFEVFDKNVTLKQDVMSYVLANDIRDFSQFQKQLEGFGKVKLTHPNKLNEYISVREPHNSRYTRLKEFVFSREFIETYSRDEKIEFLQKREEEKYIERKPIENKSKLLQYQKDLNYWYDLRAKEVKYINNDTVFYKEQYKKYSKEERVQHLSKVEKNFYKKNSYEFKTPNKELNNEVTKPIKFKENINPKGDREKTLYISPNREYSRGVTPTSRDNMLTLSSIPLVHDRKRYSMLLQPDALNHMEERGRGNTFNQVRWSHGSDSSTLSSKREESVLGQKLLDYETSKFYAKQHINMDMSTLFHQLQLPPQKYKLVDGKIICGSKEYLEPMLFLEQEMNYKKTDVEILEHKILDLQEKINKGIKMIDLKTNIQVNSKNKNSVDYFQIGTQDAAQRFTGVVQDRASQYDTAKAFVVNEKVVSQQFFKDTHHELYDAIVQKQTDLFISHQTVKYNDKLRCDVSSNNTVLTRVGEGYANSQYNMQTLTPVQMGITPFKKQLDKNFFTIAKNFISAKEFRDDFKVAYEHFKQNVKAIFTEKPELAASNIIMAAELQMLKQNLQDIKTAHAAQLLLTDLQQGQQQNQQSQQSQEQQPQKEVMTLKAISQKIDDIYDIYDNTKNQISLKDDLESFKSTLSDTQVKDFESLSDLSKNVVNSKIPKDIASSITNDMSDINTVQAANLMSDNGLKIGSVQDVVSMAETIGKTMSMADAQGLSFDKLLGTLISQLQVNQNQNTQGQER